MELTHSNRRTLTEKLDEAMQNLRRNVYEDNNSETYRMLSEFIREAEKVHGSARLVRSTEALMAILD